MKRQNQQDLQQVSKEIFSVAKDIYRQDKKKERIKKEFLEKEDPEKILDELSET